jgi:hypothetical protein
MAIEDLHLRTHAVSSLAQEAARNGPRDLALRMVESVPKGPCREEAIAQVVSVLPAQSERQDLMNDVMRRLRVYMKHTPSLALDALERIVCVEAIGACVNEAVDLILGLEDALRREELLLRLAEHIELRPSYERLLQSLLSACRTGAYRKERILTCLGQAVVCAYQEGEDAWSLKTLDSLPHGPEKTRTMVQLAHCARDQQLARELTLKALDIVSASPEEYCRRNDGTLPLLLSRLLAVGETKPGLQLVRKCIPHLWHKQKAVLLTAKCADPAEKHAVIEDTLQALLRHAGAPAKVALGHLMNAVLDCIAESLPPQNGAVGLAKLAHLFPEQRDGMLREALHVSLSEATLSPFQSNRDIFRVDRLRTRFPNYLMTPLHTVMAECASAGLVEDVTAAALAQNSIEELIGACVAIQGKLPTAAFQSIIRQGLLKCEVISGSPATCALDLVKLSDSLTNSDDAGAVLGKACSLAIAIPDVGDLLNLVIELTERGVAWSHTKHLLDKAPSMPSGHIRLTLGLLGKHAMQSHHLVSAVFHIAARQGRSFLLSRLAQFSGAIHALGGIAALEEAASSINEVGQWRS